MRKLAVSYHEKEPGFCFSGKIHAALAALNDSTVHYVSRQFKENSARPLQRTRKASVEEFP